MSKTQRGQRPDRHIPDGSGGRETCCRVGVKTSWSPESQDHLSILSEVTVLERVVSVIVTVTITECECDPLVTSGCHDVTLLSPGVLVITDLSPLSLSSFTWLGPGHRSLPELVESSESKSWQFLREKYNRDLANLEILEASTKRKRNRKAARSTKSNWMLSLSGESV